MEKPLKELIAEYIAAYKDIVERNALAETPKETAFYLLELVRQRVEGVRNPYIGNSKNDFEYARKLFLKELE